MRKNINEEKVFNIEEYILKATAFHKDKERAEKLSKKKGYLSSLCSSLEDMVFFKEVYAELFPNDKNTINLLESLINETFLEESDSWLFLHIETKEEFDVFRMQVKTKVKSILKMLKHQQIAQINRIHRKAREEQELREYLQKNEAKRKEMVEEKAKTEKYTLIDELRRMTLEEKQALMISLDGAVLHNMLDQRLKNLTPQRRKMLIGKRLEDLSPEIRRELMNDRVHARQRLDRLPEMMQEIERHKRIEKQTELRRKQRAFEPPKQLGR